MAKMHKSINFIAVNLGSLLNTNMVAAAYGKHCSDTDKGGNILHEFAVAKNYDSGSGSGSGKYFDNDKSDIKGTYRCLQ